MNTKLFSDLQTLFGSFLVSPDSKSFLWQDIVDQCNMVGIKVKNWLDVRGVLQTHINVGHFMRDASDLTIERYLVIKHNSSEELKVARTPMPLPKAKKLPKGVKTRHHRVVRFSDGIKGKLYFDRMEDGSLKVWAPGRVTINVRNVGSTKKPFRGTVSDKQKRSGFVSFSTGASTERDAFRGMAVCAMNALGW